MKFQSSAIAATSLSGKSGGTTATKTNIFRKKSNPRQPNSTKQSAVRARLASLSTAWGALTPAQQDAWIAAAPNFVLYDNGEPYTLKGNTLYQRVNNNLIEAGQATVLLPPTPQKIPNITISNMQVDTEEPIFTFVIDRDGLTGDAPFTLIVYASPLYPPGQRYCRRKLRVITTIDLESDVPELLPSWLAAGFGELILGMRVAAGIKIVNNTTGQKSPLQILQTIVVPLVS